MASQQSSSTTMITKEELKPHIEQYVRGLSTDVSMNATIAFLEMKLGRPIAAMKKMVKDIVIDVVNAIEREEEQQEAKNGGKHARNDEDEVIQKKKPKPSMPEFVALDDKGLKRVTATTFNRVARVNIREYYKNGSGEVLSTKKGITLTEDQWERFKASIPTIDAIFEREKTK